MTVNQLVDRDLELHSKYEAVVAELEQVSTESMRLKLTLSTAIESTDRTFHVLRIETTRSNQLAVENATQKHVIDAVVAVANNSSGISGWHLNGDIAGWNEILPEIYDIETPVTDAALAEMDAKQIWDGKSLPPVGCECEVASEEYDDWARVEIVYERNNELIAIVKSHNHDYDELIKFGPDWNRATFRPVGDKDNKPEVEQ